VAGDGESDVLRDLLRQGLIERLQPAGWDAIDTAGRRFSLICFARPLASGLEAIAEVGEAVSFPDRAPIRIDDVRVGIGYEPLRRLSSLLGDQFSASVLSRSATRPEDLELGGEDDDGDEEIEHVYLSVIGGREAVPGAVQKLAELVLAEAVPFAERFVSLDALLAELADPEDRSCLDVRVPALLGAAGRFDQALAALDRYHEPAGSNFVFRRERRSAYQLRRWATNRGDPSLLPARPPPDTFEHPRKRQSLSQIRADSRARQQAVRAVQQQGRGRDRDALRQMLQEQLTSRGLTESPLWMERTLDHLWDTPAQQVRLALQGLTVLGRFGLGVAKAIRDRELPDLSTPDWLEPPDPAFYELPRAEKWIAIELDPDAYDWLERVHAAARPIAGIASVDSWLRWQPGNDRSRIAVHIGERAVGTMPENVTPVYLDAMSAADFREELARVPSRLARRPAQTFLLELASPTE
jgi:hypothetical protein